MFIILTLSPANHDSSHAQENEYEKMTPATPSCDTDGYVTTGPSRHMTKAERVR